MHQKRFGFFLAFLLCCVIGYPQYAQDSLKSSAEPVPEMVPWDSILARIQIVEALSEPDSIKKSYMSKIFNQYMLTIDDYRQFYLSFETSSMDKKQQFISDVKEILEYFQQNPAAGFGNIEK